MNTTTTTYSDYLLSTLAEWQKAIDDMSNFTLNPPPGTVLLDVPDTEAVTYTNGKNTLSVSRINVSLEHGNVGYLLYVTEATVNGVKYHRQARVRSARPYNSGTDTYGEQYLDGNAWGLSRVGSYSSGEVTDAARRKLEPMLVEAVEANGGSLEHLAAITPLYLAYEKASNEKPYLHGKYPSSAARAVRELLPA